MGIDSPKSWWITNGSFWVWILWTCSEGVKFRNYIYMYIYIYSLRNDRCNSFLLLTASPNLCFQIWFWSLLNSLTHLQQVAINATSRFIYMTSYGKMFIPLCYRTRSGFKCVASLICCCVLLCNTYYGDLVPPAKDVTFHMATS